MSTDVIPQTNIIESTGPGISQAVVDIQKININGGYGFAPVTILHYSWINPQMTKKLWGLFEGVKIDDQDIKLAKQSLFPSRF